MQQNENQKPKLETNPIRACDLYGGFGNLFGNLIQCTTCTQATECLNEQINRDCKRERD